MEKREILEKFRSEVERNKPFIEANKCEITYDYNFGKDNVFTTSGKIEHEKLVEDVAILQNGKVIALGRLSKMLSQTDQDGNEYFPVTYKMSENYFPYHRGNFSFIYDGHRFTYFEHQLTDNARIWNVRSLKMLLTDMIE